MLTNTEELSEVIDMLSELIEVSLEEGSFLAASTLDICYKSLLEMRRQDVPRK
jgi:hypothetical protein